MSEADVTFMSVTRDTILGVYQSEQANICNQPTKAATRDFSLQISTCFGIAIVLRSLLQRSEYSDLWKNPYARGFTSGIATAPGSLLPTRNACVSNHADSHNVSALVSKRLLAWGFRKRVGPERDLDE